MDWSGTWNTIKNFFVNNIWNIVTFFAILVIGTVIIKVILNIFRRVMSKAKMEKVTQAFLYKVIKFALYLFLIIVLLNTIGISVSGIVTALSAVVLAVGMALQGNIANLANGIVIVSSKIFKKGDFISVSGVDGSVEDINFLFTTITTPDNKRITLPNSTIVNGNVINYGANPTRRLEFKFSVAYETDVELVKKVCIDVMRSNGKVRLDIAEPFCRLSTLGASSIDFTCRCWVDSEDYWDVNWYVIENVYNEFKRNGISVPYNQLEIRERKDNVVMPVIERPLPERVEKVRIAKKKLVDLENDDLLSLITHRRPKKVKKTKQNAKDSTEVKTVDKSNETK